MKYLVNPAVAEASFGTCTCIVNSGIVYCENSAPGCNGNCPTLQYCQSISGPKFSPTSINAQK